MEITLHSLVLPEGSFAYFNYWGKNQWLAIAEETINFLNRILKSVERQKTAPRENIIEQRIELSSFYKKVYNESCKTEHLLIAHGIDWSRFDHIKEDEHDENDQIKKLILHFGYENQFETYGCVWYGCAVLGTARRDGRIQQRQHRALFGIGETQPAGGHPGVPVFPGGFRRHGQHRYHYLLADVRAAWQRQRHQRQRR